MLRSLTLGKAFVQANMQGEKMKVIVADDSLVMRKIIINIVESLGYEVIPAANGDQLLEILHQSGHEISLVLLDCNMPGVNGLEALKAIQSNSRFQSIPVVMISTESEESKVEEALKFGARGYLAKPFTPEKLLDKIRDILK
ncbi:MAG: response regulator [Desulfobacterota bacterium]|nr:response regulator [Thermodesulfobacteriota bacterium]